MKRSILWIQIVIMAFTLTACGAASRQQESLLDSAVDQNADDGGTLIYGSGDYTRINPAMDEHGEINILIFNGLTAHNGENEVVPGLAKSWDFDEGTCTYTFRLEEGVKWHDGEEFTAEDVKFTIEAIMNPENGSENAPHY